MTKKQLHDYRQLKSYVNALKAQCDDLIMSSSGAGDGVHSGRVPKPVESVAEKRAKIEKRITKHEAELREVEEYIENCAEQRIGTMLKWHYIQGKSWTSVALRIGGNNTKDSVRMMCHRYVEKNP